MWTLALLWIAMLINVGAAVHSLWRQGQARKRLVTVLLERQALIVLLEREFQTTVTFDHRGTDVQVTASTPGSSLSVH